MMPGPWVIKEFSFLTEHDYLSLEKSEFHDIFYTYKHLKFHA